MLISQLLLLVCVKSGLSISTTNSADEQRNPSVSAKLIDFVCVWESANPFYYRLPDDNADLAKELKSGIWKRSSLPPLNSLYRVHGKLFA